MKLNISTGEFWLSAMSVVLGFVCIIVGMIMPPSGVIDSSVLIAFGEALTFAGAVLGIDYKYRNKNREDKGKAKEKQ